MPDPAEQDRLDLDKFVYLGMDTNLSIPDIRAPQFLLNGIQQQARIR
jgi:hypothetical protein